MAELAKPVRLGAGRYEPCTVEEATHVTLNIPGPVGILTLPVMLKGTREGTGNWTWNGSTTAPTLRPSVLNTGHAHRCHTWITDGQAQYLDDCSHDLRGQTLALKEVVDMETCPRCSGSGEDPEGFYDQSRGPDGATHDGPCRDCEGTGARPAAQPAQAGADRAGG